NQSRCSAGIIADGPKGPAFHAKMGAVELARRTGLPIVPGNWWASRRLTFGSWDRTIVPLPFTRMTFAFEPPLHVAPDATRDEMEAIRRELTRRLQRARNRARLHCAHA
ncbi:MAG: hypothetical protein KC466_02475, partial [Myxococcales bacterium]|nr:hypothetical protein [Myxococcales bacterium]